MSAAGDKKDFFISRAGADKEAAIWIAQELRAAGFTTVLQDDDSHPGYTVPEVMREGAR
jgi:phage replication-related protein YjqB (UPF0714/DUF867 family)